MTENEEKEWRYAERQMNWYGWATPVGLGLGALFISLSALLVRLAILGLPG